MSSRLTGKVAVITGAGSGLGAAFSRRYIEEGAKVVAADISGQQEAVARELGPDCIAVHGDVSNSSEVQAMLAAAVERFGRIDILCNNAGIDGPMALTGECLESDFDRTWAINGRGVFLGMRYGIPLMLQSGGGSIINTASIASVVAFPQMVAYCAAKGAVLMMTRTAAVEYAARGIRVNAICPGVVRSGMTSHIPREQVDAVAKRTPMRRFAEAAEVAELAVFLGSDESSFITGTSVMIDGGYTAV